MKSRSWFRGTRVSDDHGSTVGTVTHIRCQCGRASPYVRRRTDRSHSHRPASTSTTATCSSHACRSLTQPFAACEQGLSRSPGEAWIGKSRCVDSGLYGRVDAASTLIAASAPPVPGPQEVVRLPRPNVPWRSARRRPVFRAAPWQALGRWRCGAPAGPASDG